MRLADSDRKIIKTVILKYIKNPKIILFGSRTDDSKKGGDIDILVQTDENINLKKQIKILAEIELNGVERKVDMLFKTPHSKEQNIFKTALDEGIVL